jgi:hypothetical protein
VPLNGLARTALRTVARAWPHDPASLADAALWQS